MKRKESILLGIGLLLISGILSSCMFAPSPLEATVAPLSGHPPFPVVVTAVDRGGGTYTFEATGCAVVQSTDHVFRTVVHEWPWQCVVSWTDGTSGTVQTIVTVALENTGPTINRPLIQGQSDNWWGEPLERTLIECNYREETPLYPGYLPVVTGIKDPEGDDWTLVSIEIQCDLQDKPDTLFHPPYREGELHADGIENAGIWYPCYIAPKEKISGLPYPPHPERGYPFDACMDNNLAKMPSQMATITITARDVLGATTTEKFRIPCGPTGCSKGG